MKPFALWAALLSVLVTVFSIALLYWQPAASAVKRFVVPGALSSRHAYLDDRCAACHEPTVGITVASCTACHSDSERLLGRQPTMFHASIEECAACHVEHTTANVRPVVMDHVELAKVGARTLARASGSDPDSAATLSSLATWLKVRDPDKIDASAAREALNCAGCHDRKDPHLKRFGIDCAQCHEFGTWRIPGYQHPSSGSKECVQCHQPPPSHLMGHFSMISQKIAGKEHARVDQCYECHNTTGWNDIVNRGYYKHH